MNGQIRIKEPFNEQYTLIIESDLMAINAKMQSKTQIRWDVSILAVSDEQIEMRLLLLDHILLESNNPLIKELTNLTKSFSRLYNELHLILAHDGTIKEVLNIDIILGKWQQTKAEMSVIAEANPDIKKVVLLNDSIFQNADKLKEGVQKSEFFMVFFHSLFGNNLPHESSVIKPNFFNTANIKWNLSIAPEEAIAGTSLMSLSLRAVPSLLQQDFNDRAYSQFADKIDVKKLNPVLIEEGRYKVDFKTGRIVEAVLKKNETADKDMLYTKMTYTLLCDELYRQRIAGVQKSEPVPAGTELQAQERKPMSATEYTLWKYEQYKAEQLLKKK